MRAIKTVFCSNQTSITSRLTATLMGISFLVGTAATAILPAKVVAQNSSPDATQVTLPDGIYLYGQSSKPDEIGQGYFVFEAKKGQVVGALYMPHSSFDCAAGSFKGDQLALTVTNSYDRVTNPFEIALEQTSNVASSNGSAPTIGLQGFQKLDVVSENDQRILNVCKADLQEQTKP